MSNIGKFSKDIGWFSISNVIQAVSGILLLPLITKSLSAYQYGLWSQLLVTLSLLSAVTTLGLGSGVVRFLPGEKALSRRQDIFYSSFLLCAGTSCIVATFILIFSSSIANTLFESETWIVLTLPILLLLQNIIESYISLFKAFREIKYLSAILVVRKVVFLILAVIALTNGHQLISLITIYTINELFILLILAGKSYNMLGIKFPSFKGIGELVRYSVPISMANISSWVLNSSDRYIIGIFLGVTSVGYYAAAYAIGIVIQNIIHPVSITIIPTLSKYYDENDTKNVSLFIHYPLKYFLLLAIPSVFGQLVLSYELLTLFTTVEIAQNSAFITPIIGCVALFMGCQGVIYAPILLAKKTQILLWITSLATVLNVTLNILFVPTLGIIGAALGTLSSSLSSLILVYYYANRYLTIQIDWRFILKCIIASMIMGIVIYPIKSAIITQLIFTIIFGVVVYFALILIMKGITVDEIKKLITHIRHS